MPLHLARFPRPCATISGTLRRASTGGRGELNPYSQFLKIEPTANLGGGVLLYSGQFDVSVLSGEGLVVEASKLLSQDRVEDAVALLEEAVSLAPSSVRLNFLLATTLAKSGRNDEAEQQGSQGRKLADELYPDRGLILTFIMMQ